MTDEMKSSRGAANKPHFKPLACQRCWTRRSIVVWELCHSVSLHRAAASEELTNLSLRRDQGKMSATMDHTCMHCWHWTEHFSFSFPCAAPPAHTAGQMGCQCCRMIKRWESFHTQFGSVSLKRLPVSCFLSHTPACVCTIVANLLSGVWEPQLVHSTATQWCDSSHLFCVI